jgi:FkbM family methyltransferase
MEIIAFHINHFSLRGSEIAIYDYARYNEELLGNKSIIFVQNSFREKIDYRGIKVHNDKVYNKFNQKFKIIEYSSLNDLQSLCSQNGATIFYNLKSGEKDGMIIQGIKNVNHCVFTYNKQNAHGDIYIPISPTIVDYSLRNITPHVPHVIQFPIADGHLRDFLGIPKDAIVFGRHGGEETFNIPFVHKVVQQIAEENENIYFLFLNTQLFCNPRKNIIYIQGLTEHVDKSRFINSCDAMLHARKEGESFGIAIAEFSVSKKPIITWKNKGNSGMKIDVEHTHHIDVLGDIGLYYSNEDELKCLLKNFSKIDKSSSNYESLDCYSRLYSPEVVMNLFEKYIINCKQSVYNYTSIVEFKGQKYIHFDNDDVAKSLYKHGWEPNVYKTISLLLNPGEMFIDIGSNIGYHTVRIAGEFPKSNVISIEPQADIFNLLKYNVAINNLKNVSCLNIGTSSIRATKYIPKLSFDTKNMGDITVTTIENSKCSDSVSCIDIDYILKDYNNVRVIKIDVSGNELDVLKGSIEVLIKQRPFIILPLESHVCKNNGYTCRSIKNLLYSIQYTMVEINSDYPCDHLCYPNEKKDEVDKLFEKYITDNTVNNTINDNLSLGISKSIRYESIRDESIRDEQQNEIPSCEIICHKEIINGIIFK